MKVIHNILLILIISVVMLALLSCTASHAPPSAAGVHKDHAIKLQVTNSGAKLKVNTGPSPNCRATTHRDGCVDVPKGDTATAKFELIGSPQWFVKTLKICQGIPKSSLTNCSLEFRQRADFEVSEGSNTLKLYPTKKGVVDLTSLSTTLKNFYVNNYNVIPQDYFYAIQACKGNSTTECAWTDPPMENGGRK